MPEGRQSPPPERQTGAQQQSPPGSGQGIDNAAGKDKEVNEQLKNLKSNPAGALDNVLEDKFAKKEGN